MYKGSGVTGYPAKRANYPGPPKVPQPIATHHTNQREMATKRNGTAKGLSKPKYPDSSAYNDEEDKYDIINTDGRRKGILLIFL